MKGRIKYLKHGVLSLASGVSHAGNLPRPGALHSNYSPVKECQATAAALTYLCERLYGPLLPLPAPVWESIVYKW